MKTKLLKIFRKQLQISTQHLLWNCMPETYHKQVRTTCREVLWSMSRDLPFPREHLTVPAIMGDLYAFAIKYQKHSKHWKEDHQHEKAGIPQDISYVDVVEECVKLMNDTVKGDPYCSLDYYVIDWKDGWCWISERSLPVFAHHNMHLNCYAHRFSCNKWVFRSWKDLANACIADNSRELGCNSIEEWRLKKAIANA